MTRSAILSIALFLGTRAFAAYDKFHYTTEASNWLCPGMSWQCIAPSICAHDGLTDLYNCCDSDADDAVCWNNSTPCEGEDEKTPASNQIGCSSGSNAFCCLKGREECTQRFNQINVCWEIAADPFRNVSQAKMNATFSSLSSASPSASTLAIVDISVLTAISTSAASTITSTTSTSTRRSQSPSTATHVSTTSLIANTLNTPSSEPESKNGISGGTIGGAVVGAVVGMALVGGGAFFLFRRRRGSNSAPKGGELDGHGPANVYLVNQTHLQSVPQEKYAHEVADSNYALQELSANNQPVEMDGSSTQPPKVPHSFA
ncbi:hypothetical protein P171DRAFT_476820 [Karstenula rhodostoma CBS 690.94]|uniref:Extracellular membrane protein CFEM domain-containing protein n=1 Tax=Karstenula rhodostoma CBS 690.94 TaxID=1392251 RepID=A0A9P4U7A0_9PLEO|nr:hypothetical protein P171DRAFT_476820 [Karstenula rhodostoma CBS 690.94]